MIEVNELCGDAAEVKVSSMHLTPSEIVLFDKLDWENDPNFWNDIWRFWFFGRILTYKSTELFLCSPEGLLLRSSHHLVNSFFDNDFHPSDGVEAAKRYYMEEEFRFCFIDTYRSIIRKNPLPADIPNLDFSFPKNASFYTEAIFEADWEVLSKFDGWAVCISNNSLPKDTASLLQLDFNAPVTSRSRSRKVDRARVCYDALFPNGHDAIGLTWKQAAKTVSIHLKDATVSTDTLRRALGKKT